MYLYVKIPISLLVGFRLLSKIEQEEEQFDIGLSSFTKCKTTCNCE